MRERRIKNDCSVVQLSQPRPLKGSGASGVVILDVLNSYRFKDISRILAEYLTRRTVIQEYVGRQELLDFSPAGGSSVLIELRPMLSHDRQDLGEVLHGLTIRLELPARETVVMNGFQDVDPQELAITTQLVASSQALAAGEPIARLTLAAVGQSLESSARLAAAATSSGSSSEGSKSGVQPPTIDLSMRYDSSVHQA